MLRIKFNKETIKVEYKDGRTFLVGYENIDKSGGLTVDFPEIENKELICPLCKCHFVRKHIQVAGKEQILLYCKCMNE